MSDIILESILINLNSNDATLSSDNGSYKSTFLSNVSFKFQGLLKEDENIISTSIDLWNAEIPVSFYQINYSNNKLNVLYNGSINVIYTITEGNYSITTLLKEITTQTYGLITPTFYKLSGLVTFTLSSGTYTNFRFLPSSISRIIGFDNTNIYSSTAFVLIAPYPISLLTIKKIKICSSELSTSSLDSNAYNINMIRSIAINAVPYGIINYQTPTILNTLLSKKNIDSIDIQLLDDNNNYLDFHNIPWTMTLLITKHIRQRQLSRTTFQDGINQAILPVMPAYNLANPETITNTSLGDSSTNKWNDLLFNDDTDLDLLMYNNGIDI